MYHQQQQHHHNHHHHQQQQPPCLPGANGRGGASVSRQRSGRKHRHLFVRWIETDSLTHYPLSLIISTYPSKAYITNTITYHIAPYCPLATPGMINVVSQRFQQQQVASPLVHIPLHPMTTHSSTHSPTHYHHPLTINTHSPTTSGVNNVVSQRFQQQQVASQAFDDDGFAPNNDEPVGTCTYTYERPAIMPVTSLRIPNHYHRTSP